MIRRARNTAGDRGRSTGRRESGIALLEALVATGITMVSLMGIAKLMLTSIANTQEAGRYATASTLAGEIIDRARANATVIDLYSTTYSASGVGHGCGTTSAHCAPASQAEDDIFVWKHQLAAVRGGLPDGAGSVALLPVGGMKQIIVAVKWNERGEERILRLTSWL